MTSKTELNAFHKPDNAYRSLSNTTVSITKKNRSNNELADKSYVLHSVENKLFTITDADTNDTFSKTCQNRDPRNQKVGEDGSIANTLVDNLKSNLPSAKANDFSNTKEYEKKLSYNKCAKTTPENDENDHRSTGKKNAPICQSTPMLLGRYLKYNKTIDDSKNFSTWRTSAEFLKDDDDEIANDGGQHQMNVSYIKETSPLPEPNKSGDSFSKLENYLNSTYDIQEDDQASSTSESSVSSFGNKPTYSIRDVQKNAELQERSKPKCFAIFSFAGRPFVIFFLFFANRFKTAITSIKLWPRIFEKLRKYVSYSPSFFKILNFNASSDFELLNSFVVSSSNESISAFSPISSSNEGFVDSKINVSCRTISKLSYPSRRPHTAGTLVIFFQLKILILSNLRLFWTFFVDR